MNEHINDFVSELRLMLERSGRTVERSVNEDGSKQLLVSGKDENVKYRLVMDEVHFHVGSWRDYD